ncbi:MAG: hypothetical protein ACYTFW_20795 [Planctomycetota bacterium]
MKYRVRDSKGVIKEMARYDNATIVSMEVADTERNKKVLERFSNSEEQEQFLKYDAVLESEHCTIDRWRSFGTLPEMLEE